MSAYRSKVGFLRRLRNLNICVQKGHKVPLLPSHLHLQIYFDAQLIHVQKCLQTWNKTVDAIWCFKVIFF